MSREQQMVLGLFAYAVPVAVGIVAGRRLNRLLNFLLMSEVYQLLFFLRILVENNAFKPILLIPGMIVFAGMLSPGGMIPPLLFLLVALLRHQRSPAPHIRGVGIAVGQPRRGGLR